MSNPPRAKGTGAETELLRKLDIESLVRAPASSVIDLKREGWDPSVRALATRPNRGQWLFTIDLPTFRHYVELFDQEKDPFEHRIEIEVKRYARFAHHSLYEGKFNR